MGKIFRNIAYEKELIKIILITKPANKIEVTTTVGLNKQEYFES